VQLTSYKARHLFSDHCTLKGGLPKIEQLYIQARWQLSEIADEGDDGDYMHKSKKKTTQQVCNGLEEQHRAKDNTIDHIVIG
jgi:hypothetical protein